MQAFQIQSVRNLAEQNQYIWIQMSCKYMVSSRSL